MKFLKNNKNYIILFICLVVFDQITKYIISSNLDLWESIPVISGFFHITYVQNTGAGWSILEGQMGFFYLITIFAVVLLFFYLRNLESWRKASRVAIWIVLAGIIGNFVDRLILQYVVDFFDFTIIGYRFPTFNIADMCIVVGFGLWMLEEIFIWAGVKTKWINSDSK